MTTLLALDGNSLYHRAYHAYSASPMPRADGQPNFAVYGFFALLNGVIEKTSPDVLVVAFDDADRNERKEKWPHYKAQRDEKPQDLVAQLERTIAVLGAAGIRPAIVPGWEADDVVASAAAIAEGRGWDTIVATSDRDAFSLITDRTRVLRLVSGLDNAQMLDPDALYRKYGVRPDQYLDFAALRGDKSDNLPGVDGIGEKTAVRLLEEFGTVQAALDDPDRLTEVLGHRGRKLLDGVDAWRHNCEVMSQRRDFPIDLDGRTVAGVDTGELATVLRKAELPNLVSRYAAVFGAGNRRRDRSTRAQVQPQAPPAEQAPPPPPPSGVSGHAQTDGGRGPGRGLPAVEQSTPDVEVEGQRLSSTGGSHAPDDMPLTMA